MQSGFHGGSAKYRGTGRSFGLATDSLLTLYQQYARSHYHHALQLLTLLLLYVLLLTDEPLHVVLLKSYAVLLACLSWLIAPALFNPAITIEANDTSNHLSSIIAEKKIELRSVWAWLHRPFVNDSGQSSWEAWYWEERFAVLQLRAIRLFTQRSGGRLRRLSQHPISLLLWESLLRLLEWSPWLFLSLALIVSHSELLPTFLVYTGLLLVSMLSPLPRAIRLAFLCTCVLFYYTSVHMIDAGNDIMMRVS